MSHPRIRPQGTLATALAVLFWLMLAGSAGSPASAATTAPSAYQFWGYYQLTDGAWSFAQTGPDGTTPPDGSVEGWRFAIADVSTPRLPRATPSFEDVCAGTAAQDGQKQVAVVIDYGRPADATDGRQPPPARAQCAAVPEEATGADVLATVAETRVEGGLVCGLDGYPPTGCGDAVAEVPAQAAEPDQPVNLAGLPGAEPTGTGTSAGAAAGAEGEDQAGGAGQQGGSGATWLLALAVTVLVAAIALLALRRRRDAVED